MYIARPSWMWHDLCRSFVRWVAASSIALRTTVPPLHAKAYNPTFVLTSQNVSQCAEGKTRQLLRRIYFLLVLTVADITIGAQTASLCLCVCYLL